jgi:hypothetical protein
VLCKCLSSSLNTVFHSWGLPDTMATECILWKKFFLKHEKKFVWLNMLTISIPVQNLFLWTAKAITSKFDFQTHTQVYVVANYKAQNNVVMSKFYYPIHADCDDHCRHHPKLYLNTCITQCPYISILLSFDSWSNRNSRNCV